MKKAVLLINLGTPDSPSVNDVRPYLREFLMDWRVIDIPWIARFFLVNGIIAPFRAFNSAKIYKELWTENGSPLKHYGNILRDEVQKKLPSEYKVFLAMRYQNPSIASMLKEIREQAFSELIVLPLFPQYASASTGSAADEVLRIVRKWQVIPNVRVIQQFFDHPKFIESFVKKGKKYLDNGKYDFVLFSYHGIPESQIKKASILNHCQLSECCKKLIDRNRFCYRAQCFATTRILAKELGLEENQYQTSFQSRLGPTPWIKPYSDKIIEQLAKEGKKKILVFSPAFIADCLETTIEIGEEYKELFQEHGGEKVQLVESLNDDPIWFDCVVDLILNDQQQASIRGVEYAVS